MALIPAERVGDIHKPDNAAPWLHPHYRSFIATTSSPAPHSGIGILPRGFGHLSFPFASRTKFSRSIPKPVLRSCRLYTGCHRDRKQVSSRFILEQWHNSSFDSAFNEVTMRHRTVCFRSSPQHTPDVLNGRLFHSRSPPRLLNAAAPGGLKPAPASRLREAVSHLWYSITSARSCS